jgi:biotin-(acetyl-CoA carboxylase) ligase
MMKNDKNGRTGSVNCLKMHSIRKAETVHETDSTNAELKRRAANGVLKDGTVLIAERQTRGRGRRGRKWENTSGALLMSIACDAEDIAAEDILWLRLRRHSECSIRSVCSCLQKNGQKPTQQMYG